MNDTNDYQKRREAQLAFEQVRKLRAVQKYRKDLKRMRYELKGGYLSGTDTGRSIVLQLIKQITPKLEKLLDEQPAYRISKSNAINAQLIVKLLGIPEVLGITIKAFIDATGREKDLPAVKVISTAASRLELEWCRRRWETMNKEAVQWLQRRYKRAGTWHKITACSVILQHITGASSTDLKSEVPRIAFAEAAGYILEAIALETRWFTRETVNIAKNKKKSYINLSPVFEEWYRRNNEAIEDELQQLYPMLCPPNDWDSEGNGGGYLDPVGRVSKLQKTEKGTGSTVSKKQLNLINNALQKTEWQINPFIFEVQNQLFGTAGAAVGSFKPICFHPLTNEAMPDHIAALDTSHPARVAWRKEKSLINSANAESRRNGIRTVRNIQASRLYINEDKFWVPWSLGHNGRAYVLSAGCLSPQGTDSERSLLRFANGAPINDRAVYHLTLNLANLFGITDSHQAKVDWVNNNTDLITAIATDPLDYIPQWEEADEPWQFLAACDEYYRLVIAKTDTITHLPVFNDATASGVQILSLLARDANGAEKVNLIPGKGQKMDIYAALKPLLKEELSKVVDEYGRPDLVDLYLPRKAYKRNLVSRIYGSVLRSRKKAIADETLKAHNYQLNILQPGDALIIAECLERAMQRLAPGALALFDDLALIGKLAASDGKTVTWTTPVGNTVCINPLKNPITKVDLGWFGHVSIADDRKKPELDKAKVRTSTAPLFVHNLDAAILAESFHEWRSPLSCSHDCVGVLATDVDAALHNMLSAYVTVLKDGEQLLKRVAHDNGLNIEFHLANTLSDTQVSDIVNCEYALC